MTADFKALVVGLRLLAIGILAAAISFAQSPSLAIGTTSPLPSGVVGVAYSQTLFATGGVAPYSWSAGSLPGGLQLGQSSGMLSGTPNSVGTFSFVVQVVDASNAISSKSFNLTINSSSQSNPVAITTPPLLPAATVGAPYSQTIFATGGFPPYRWSGSPPAGLQLDPVTGVLSGTPTAVGTFSFIIQAADASNTTSSKVFNLTVNSSPVPTQITITTASPLPSGTVGAPYSQTISATGGVPPYRWSGNLPAGLQLDPVTGAISGTPAAPGTFNFTIQAADASHTTTKAFTLTINPSPLSITTQGPLFDATVGVFYSQSFQASGGVSPYTWTISGSSAPGLTFDTNQGTLSGTPTAAGAYTLTIQVSDSAGAHAFKTFSLTVATPKPTITTASPLPNGTAGVSYSQNISATGGTPPYSWTLIGSVSGLQIDSSSGVLSGTPTNPGTYTFTLQLKDAGGATTSKVFTLTISPGALTLTTDTQLPGGILGQTYSQQLTAAGGSPPYLWTSNGLPDGLTLDSGTGLISGTLQVAGSLVFTVTAADSARVSVTDLFHLNVGVPPPPSATISGLPDTSNPGDQPRIQLSIESAYPFAIAGQLTLSFAPEVGPGDSTIQFVTGARTVNFTIPAGTTDARFPVPSLGLQTGTVAGAITVTARLTTGGLDITPSPAPSITTRVSRAAPVIVSAKLVRNANGFSIQITGFSTAREITQATFRFKAQGGSALQQSEITIQLLDLFSKWYQDANSVRFGSQFFFSQPFTIQGDANMVIPDTVTLANSLGSATSPVN